MLDPRNPKTVDKVHVDSNHVMHKGLYKTLVLMALKTDEEALYFVVEGCTESLTFDELQKSSKYLYEEHTCPINFIPCLLISYHGDCDPHGVFTFIEAVWMTKDFANLKDGQEDYLIHIWPVLAKKPKITKISPK